MTRVLILTGDAPHVEQATAELSSNIQYDRLPVQLLTVDGFPNRDMAYAERELARSVSALCSVSHVATADEILAALDTLKDDGSCPRCASGPGEYDDTCPDCDKRRPPSTPTIYELDPDTREALTAHHYCSETCQLDAFDAEFKTAAVKLVDEPNADIADGEVCDHCEKPLNPKEDGQ